MQSKPRKEKKELQNKFTNSIRIRGYVSKVTYNHSPHTISYLSNSKQIFDMFSLLLIKMPFAILRINNEFPFTEDVLRFKSCLRLLTPLSQPLIDKTPAFFNSFRSCHTLSLILRFRHITLFLWIIKTDLNSCYCIHSLVMVC
jgi:hypothetical protein